MVKIMGYLFLHITRFRSVCHKFSNSSFLCIELLLNIKFQLKKLYLQTVKKVDHFPRENSI